MKASAPEAVTDTFTDSLQKNINFSRDLMPCQTLNVIGKNVITNIHNHLKNELSI